MTKPNALTRHCSPIKSDRKPKPEWLRPRGQQRFILTGALNMLDSALQVCAQIEDSALRLFTFQFAINDANGLIGCVDFRFKRSDDPLLTFLEELARLDRALEQRNLAHAAKRVREIDEQVTSSLKAVRVSAKQLIVLAQVVEEVLVAVEECLGIGGVVVSTTIH